MPLKFLSLAVLVLAATTCGCVAKLGAVAPTRGRAKPAASWGMEIHAPLKLPGNVGEFGGMLAFPYEEYRTSVEHAAGLSEGTLRVSSAGIQFRLLYLLPGKRLMVPKKAIEGEKEHPWPEDYEERRIETCSHSFFWVGAGPEYHWNAFVVSGDELATAALNGILYDEHIDNHWGGCVSVGLEAAWWGVAQIELSYHWAHTRTEVKGTDSGVPFKRTRAESMEWLSVYVGIGFGF